ncbi:phosphotriesterase [Chitinophaga agrisoli]|uniref:Phosphotriesterase n=1 Tax=Chitinophaga agrisoli TaxID=2607653 RepID=A0A5B2VY74_9BACT|nr:phosphotriesterase [Chitinophaga agrisoli]KAA2243272.1 phosphotriesterase [Chitinophaga agrisoli]
MLHVISRRHFLTYAPAVFSIAAWLKAAAASPAAGIIMTVNGPIRPSELGVTLPHEHVLVDFIGADKVSPNRYDEHEAYRIILPHLLSLREKGCRSLIECTPNFLGRNPRLLQRLSLAAGLHLITNTGLYGAAAHKYLPAYVQQETPEQLAGRWVAEWKNGIGDTGIKPGFIKSGMDKGPLSPLQRKLVTAAALTWRQTGLPIGIHTGDGAAAQEEAAILKEMKVPLSAWIWIHAQNEKDLAIHDQLAGAGAWVSLDGLSKENAQDYITRLTRLKQHGFLQQTLISHDAGWYNVGQPGGGQFRNYNYLLTAFVPLLKQHGFTEADIRMLTVENPARAFTIQPQPAGV